MEIQVALFSALLRPELAKIGAYNAGLTMEDVLSRCGTNPVAKLASNENPYPPASHVIEAARKAAQVLHLYPDPQGRKLTGLIAQLTNSEPGCVILGDGSEDLLNVLARCLLRPTDQVVTLYPSFPLHGDYAGMMGASVNYIGLTNSGTIDIEALVAAVAIPVRLTIFSNPMNPVGLWLTSTDLDRILDAQHPESVLCIDEAYIEYAMGGDFGSAAERLKSHPKPLLILRTFSKAYGLAGLRIGYGLSNSQELINGMNLVRTPFNVNAVAQAAALAALNHPASMIVAVTAVIAERERVKSEIERLGLDVCASKGNFLFVNCRLPSVTLADRLMVDGVLVKPWKQSGYETWFRVSIGLKHENDQFLNSLTSWRHSGM